MTHQVCVNNSDSLQVPTTDESNKMEEAQTNESTETPEKCDICGDKASGYHYNVLSCEGCKGFFRRSIQKSLVANCRFGGNCDINIFSRRKCPSCRFEKCLKVGMQENCLLTEHQCNARGSKRRMARLKSAGTVSSSSSLDSDQMSDKGSSSSGSASPSQFSPLVSPMRSYTPSTQMSYTCNTELQSTDINAKRSRKDDLADFNLVNSESGQHSPQLGKQNRLPDGLSEFVQNIVNCQEKCEKMAEEELHALLQTGFEQFGEYDTEETRQLLYLRRTQQTIINTQLAVEFAKQMLYFTEFSQADQISLIKGSISHILALKMARLYDPVTDTIRLTEKHSYTRDALQYAGLGDSTSSLFRFCKTMADMKTDAAEFGLLTCICIYSESGSLVKDIDRVNILQDIYSRALESYCDHKYGAGCRRFTRLIMKMIGLRELNLLQSDASLNLQCINNKDMYTPSTESISKYLPCQSKA